MLFLSRLILYWRVGEKTRLCCSVVVEKSENGDDGDHCGRFGDWGMGMLYGMIDDGHGIICRVWGERNAWSLG